MGCNCGGAKTASTMSWQVDIAGTGKTFTDLTTSKTYKMASEANAAIAALGLTGSIRPKPVSS